jgi:methyltransferase
MQVYIVMVFGVILEFFLVEITFNILVSVMGIILFISAFILRIYSMRTLKDQWSVHAVGAKKVKRVFFINTGPYKYIRHPIYLGVILEVISIPLIWNTYLVCLFVCIINVPLQIIRAYFEEKATIRKLGADYISYKNSVPAFIPLRIVNIAKR